jgi:RNA polymerase-binding transcription factor DksA
MPVKICQDCGNNISPGRLKAMPGTRYCVKCVDKHDKTEFDTEAIVAKSSTSARNGFAPND